jgi:hypothetical protein
MARFDSVTKPTQLSDHFSGTLLLGGFGDLCTSFFVADSSVHYLPDQAAEFVGNYSNGLIVPQTQHIAAMENLEDASFVFSRSTGSLIQNPPRGSDFIPLAWRVGRLRLDAGLTLWRGLGHPLRT